MSNCNNRIDVQNYLYELLRTDMYFDTNTLCLRTGYVASTVIRNLDELSDEGLVEKIKAQHNKCLWRKISVDEFGVAY